MSPKHFLNADQRNNRNYKCNIPHDCSGNVISWKINPTTKVAIPSNSRPNPTPSSGSSSSQNGKFGNHAYGTKWSNYGANSEDDGRGPGFICRRRGRTSCTKINGVTVTGGFAPNPIRHWRKQLFPRQGGSCSGKSRVSNIQDRPGGTVVLTQPNIFNNNFTEIYIPRSPILISCEQLEAQELKNRCKLAYKTRTHTTFKKDYHLTVDSYLQSRGKNFRQQSSVDFKKIKAFTPPPPTYPSIYKTNQPGCYQDCSCIVQVVYDPVNSVFGTNTAVAPGLYTRNKAEKTLTRNQYNIINRWGLDGVSVNKIYPVVRSLFPGYRKPMGGTSIINVCCPS